LFAVLVTGCTLASFTAAIAAESSSHYPAKPVRMIVPYPPSGGSDIMGRAVAGRLTEQMGQQMIIDNRSSARQRSAPGSRRRPADSYALLLGTITTLATNPNLRENS
jgi:tripartite-type tricarboxylate transporter receptor subunit TctC